MSEDKPKLTGSIDSLIKHEVDSFESELQRIASASDKPVSVQIPITESEFAKIEDLIELIQTRMNMKGKRLEISYDEPKNGKIKISIKPEKAKFEAVGGYINNIINEFNDVLRMNIDPKVKKLITDFVQKGQTLITQIDNIEE